MFLFKKQPAIGRAKPQKRTAHARVPFWLKVTSAVLVAGIFTICANRLNGQSIKDLPGVSLANTDSVEMKYTSVYHESRPADTVAQNTCLKYITSASYEIPASPESNIMVKIGDRVLDDGDLRKLRKYGYLDVYTTFIVYDKENRLLILLGKADKPPLGNKKN